MSHKDIQSKMAFDKRLENLQFGDIMRTSQTAGDGEADSAGVLADNSGLYGFGANQDRTNANFRLLADGTLTLSNEITVGDEDSNIDFNTSDGLTINNRFTAFETIQPGSPVMLLKNGQIARASGASNIANLASFDRLIGFTKENVAAAGTTLIQQSGIYTNNLTFESQLTNDESGRAIFGSFQQAQTFTPAVAMTCTGVTIKMFKNGIPALDTFTVSIKATSAGLPTGADLATGTFDPLSVLGNNTILDITFSASVALSSGTTYAIVVKTTSGVGDLNNSIAWYQKLTNVYASGQQATSSDDGTTWVAHTGDFYFQINGTITSFSAGSMYTISRSYSTETITIDQTTRDQLVDANQIVTQTFVASETFLSRISLYLTAGSAGAGTYTLSVQIFDEDGINISAAVFTPSVALTGAESFLAFAVDSTSNQAGDRTLLCPGKTYTIRLFCSVANEIMLGYADTDVYPAGTFTIAGVTQAGQALGFRIREVFGNGSLATIVAAGNNEASSTIGIAINTNKILLKSMPRWK